MPLPRIEHPTFPETIPSSGQAIRFRPFTVAEEKLMLIAQQSDEVSDVIHAIQQIMTACIEDDIDVGDLKPFDIEWLFLKFRAMSVNNEVHIRLQDVGEDEEIEEFEVVVDLNDARIAGENRSKEVIKIDERTSIQIEYPNLTDAQSVKDFDPSDRDSALGILSRCIRIVFHDDEQTDFQLEPEDERKAWIETFNTKTYKSIKEFFNSMPKVVIDVQLENGKTVTLEGIKSFFA